MHNQFFWDIAVLIVLFMGIAALVRLSSWGGKADAEQQKVFQVIAPFNGMPEVVVLQIFGDNLITAPLVRSAEKNKVKNELYVLKMSEKSGVHWKTERVGPLSVE
jgi:hypothetical protein